MSTVPGIKRRDRNSKSFKGKTMAKKRSIVTDNVAKTEPRRNVCVRPKAIGMIGAYRWFYQMKNKKCMKFFKSIKRVIIAWEDAKS